MLVHHRTFRPDRSFDRAFDQLTRSFFDQRPATGPIVDGSWVDDEYVVTVDLPGVPAEHVSVAVTGTTLDITADRDGTTWKRSLRLGGRLDPNKVSARHLDGRLTVAIGTVDAPEARSIEIDTSIPAIEAGDQSTDTTEAG